MSKFNEKMDDNWSYNKSVFHKTGKSNLNYWCGITSVYPQRQLIKYDRVKKWFIKK